jgi:hypothetical protein
MHTAVYAAPSEGDTASDETEVEVVSKKKKVSERSVLDETGKPQDSWLDAYGFGYKSLAENFDLNLMFKDIPDPVMRGLAAFGGVTLAGNTTNTVRNGENKGGAATEKEALLAWIENLKAGNWTSPRGELEAGLGLLAEAYSLAMGKAGKNITVEAALEKLKAADKDKRTAVRKDSRVRAELTAIQAERARVKAAETEGALVEL